MAGSRARFGESWGILWLLFALALALRLPGIDWGIVTAADGHAYLPERYSPSPPRVVYTYSTDESSFRLRSDSVEIRDFARSGSNGSFLERLPELLGRLQIGYPLASAPVSPILYAGWTVLIGGVRRLLGFSDPWLYLFYTSGRYLTAIVGALTVPVILVTYRRYFARSGEPRWIGFTVGLLAAALPSHVGLSHWISYNPIITLVELILFALIVELTLRLGAWNDAPTQPLVLACGAMLGIGIAVKPVIITLLLPLLSIIPMVAFRRDRRGDATVGAALLQSGAAVLLILTGGIAVYLLLLSYSFFFDREALNLSLLVYWRNLSGGQSGLGVLRSPMENLATYLGVTLPLGTGIGIALVGLAGFFWALIDRSDGPQRPARGLLILWYLVLVLSLGANPTGLHIGRNLTTFMLLILFSGLLLGQLWRAGHVRIGAALAAISVASALLFSLGIDLFYMTDHNRKLSSRWILENVPAGSAFVSLHEGGPTWASPEVLRLDADPFVPDGPARYRYLTQEISTLDIELEGRSLSQLGEEMAERSQRLRESYARIVDFVCTAPADYLETSTTLLSRFGMPPKELRRQIEACGYRLVGEFPAISLPDSRWLDPLVDGLYGSSVIYIYAREGS